MDALTLFSPVEMSDMLVRKVQKIRETRTQNTKARNERIREAFNRKYNEDRKRYDDVITELCTEFCIARRTVENALKS